MLSNTILSFFAIKEEEMDKIGEDKEEMDKIGEEDKYLSVNKICRICCFKYYLSVDTVK